MSDIWLGVIADLFINLAAGWFGVAFILPIATKKIKYKLQALITNVILGIVAILVAVALRGLI